MYNFTHIVTPKENDKINTIMTNLKNHLANGMITLSEAQFTYTRELILMGFNPSQQFEIYTNSSEDLKANA